MASTDPSPDGIAGRLRGRSGGSFTAKSGVDGEAVEAPGRPAAIPPERPVRVGGRSVVVP